MVYDNVQEDRTLKGKIPINVVFKVDEEVATADLTVDLTVEGTDYWYTMVKKIGTENKVIIVGRTSNDNDYNTGVENHHNIIIMVKNIGEDGNPLNLVKIDFVKRKVKV